MIWNLECLFSIVSPDSRTKHKPVFRSTSEYRMVIASERQQTCHLSQVGALNCFDVLCLDVLLTALERQPAGNRRSLASDQLGFACSRMHVAAMKQLSCPNLSIKTPTVEDLVFARNCVQLVFA